MEALKRESAATGPILILDDEQDECVLYKRLLQRYADEFPNIAIANNVAQALAVVAQQNPICCLVDYHLGDDTALDFLQRCYANSGAGSFPVLVISSETSLEMETDVLKYGAHDILRKDEISAQFILREIRHAITAHELRQRIQYYAFHDPLTGLLNRTLLMDRLDQAIASADRNGQECALIYLDLDHFKQINDSLGHRIGDELLKAVAVRLLSSCRSTDSIARLGGDEFVVLLSPADSVVGHYVSLKLLTALAQPMTLAGETVRVSVSAGIAHYPSTCRNAAELMQQADDALYKSKKQGRGQYTKFSSQQRAAWRTQKKLNQVLAHAISTGQLALAYQPIVALIDPFTVHYEALVRWPEAPMPVGADQLIDRIQNLGLWDIFHEWLFEEAIRQLAAWGQQGAHPKLNINVPASQCSRRSIVTQLRELLTKYAVAPEQIELEITESSIMQHAETCTEVLVELHELGISIAIDDFGTGYSSMARLTDLPINTLKIDQRFLINQEFNPKNHKVIEAIVALAHGLNLSVVAEGIETEKELRLARELGCDYGQGWYWGRPAIPGNDYREFMHRFTDLTAGD